MDVEKLKKKTANNEKRNKKGKRKIIFVAALSCLQKILTQNVTKY